MVRNALVVLASVVAALMIAEVVVAVWGLAPEVAVISVGRYRFSRNPAIGFELIPHVEIPGRPGWGEDFAERSNSLGFRDRDHARKKPAGTRRILVLGDSITMGLRIEDPRDIFPAVLERHLRERGHGVEVLNFGVAGYNTQQEVATLIEKGLELDPDLVLLQYCLNDREEVSGGIVGELKRLEERRPEGTPSGVEHSLLAPILVRSALYRFLHYRVLAEAKRRARNESLERLADDTVEESFELLRVTAERAGFDVAVVVFPYFTKPPDPRPQREPREHRSIAAYSAANGFAHLDLARTFFECAERSEEPISFDRLHPTRYGHECAALSIARFLVEGGLI